MLFVCVVKPRKVKVKKVGTKKVLIIEIWNPPYDINSITPGAVDEFSAQMIQAIARDLNIDPSEISIESLHWQRKGKENIPGENTPLVGCTWNDGADKPLLSQKVRDVVFQLIGEKAGAKYNPKSVVSLLARGVGGLSDLEEYKRRQAAGLI